MSLLSPPRAGTKFSLGSFSPAADLSIAVYGFLITLSPFGGSHPLLNHVLSSVTRIPHHGNETMLEPAGKMSEALTELEKHVMLNPTIVYR